MAKLWEILDKDSKEKLARIYEQLTGKKFKPPRRNSQHIRYPKNLKNLEDTDKIMRKKPPYTISVKGRRDKES